MMTRALLCVVYVGCVHLSHGICYGQGGVLDPTYESKVTSPSGLPTSISAIALQPDGRILIGGGFEAVDGSPRFRIARLHKDGRLDTSFAFIDPSHAVLSVAVQPDGKVVFGGLFNTVNGRNQSGFARALSNGTLDVDFLQGGADQLVFATAVTSDGKTVIGGAFAHVNGTARTGIARLNADGSVDPIFVPPIRSQYDHRAIVPLPNGKILVGGLLSDTNVGLHGIERLNDDGTPDSSFNRRGAGALPVTVLAVQADGRIIVGPAGRRLHPDGTIDDTFQYTPGPNHSVHAIAIQTDGRIIVGGNFTNYHGQAANRIARLLPNGAFDPSFVASFDTNVTAVVLQPDNRVLVSGSFTSVNGAARAAVARLLNDEPVMAVEKDSNNVVITWPAAYTNYSLQSRSSIPGIDWTVVPSAPTAVAGQWRVTDALSGSTRFFRLAKQ